MAEPNDRDREHELCDRSTDDEDYRFLDAVPDGAGCVDIWERLSDVRNDN